MIEVSTDKKMYMLTEELVLHFCYKVFEGVAVKAKSLIRVTRNADMDPDALYEEDIDYREFMVQLIKKRKRLAPVRLEMSHALDEKVIKKLCKYMDMDKRYVFKNNTPLDLSFLFQSQDILRQNPALFYPRRVP